MKYLGGGAFGDVFEIYRDKFAIREKSALKMIQIRDEADTQALFLSTSGQIPPGTQNGQAAIPEALRNEIQIMEALRGAPNVVTIEDFHLKRDSSSTTLFVRMELLNSFQLMMAERQRNHLPLTIPEVLKIGRDICIAQMFCEKKGIIHRDIKPGNLFIDGFGNYKVGDFGASKRMDTVHMAQTMTGTGTISYMAPEVFKGHSYNNTVDINALGLVLYQLLNNCRVPFLPAEGAYTTQDIDSANYRRLHGTPIPSLAGKIVGGERIDRQLDAIVLKACAMNLAHRYKTAKEFYNDLAHLETTEKKSTPEKRPQGSLAPEQNLQQERGRSDSKAILPAASPQDRISKSQQQKKRYSSGKKPVIVIMLLLIIAVAVMIIPQSRRGYSRSSESTDLGNTVQTKEIIVIETEEDTIPVDEVSEIVEIPDPVLKKAIQDRHYDESLNYKDVF